MLSLDDDDKAAVRAALKAMGDAGAAKARKVRNYALAAGACFVGGALAVWWLL